MKHSFVLFILLILGLTLTALLPKEEESPVVNAEIISDRLEASPNRSSKQEKNLKPMLGPDLNSSVFQREQSLKALSIQELQIPAPKDVRAEIKLDVHSTPQSFRDLAMQLAPLMESGLADIGSNPHQVTSSVKLLTERLLSCAAGEEAGALPVRALCWYNLKRLAHASQNADLRLKIVSAESSLPLQVRRLASRI
jgi:hypothetical protein